MDRWRIVMKNATRGVSQRPHRSYSWADALAALLGGHNNTGRHRSSRNNAAHAWHTLTLRHNSTLVGNEALFAWTIRTTTNQKITASYGLRHTQENSRRWQIVYRTLTSRSNGYMKGGYSNTQQSLSRDNQDHSELGIKENTATITNKMNNTITNKMNNTRTTTNEDKQPPQTTPGLRALTRQDILATVQGFWPRFRLRAKLLLMGSVRPWRLDDVLAMFSWIFVGHTVLLLAGTTTFFSLLVWILNSLQFQEYVAQKVSDYLTQELGVSITFESAIVPQWRDGTIRFTNVSVSRNGETQRQWMVLDRRQKGLSDHVDLEEVDTNFTFFELTIDTVDVTLSLLRWLEGRGLVQDCGMKGVRGVIDRRHVYYPPDYRSVRRTPQQGDFELDKFWLEDMLITVYNPRFRPFTISVFNGELPLLRKQWLFYDVICADGIVGMFDNCLFSVHRAQQEDAVLKRGIRANENSKISHLKIDGVNIDHINAGVQGPFGWITSGTLDIDLYAVIPNEPEEDVVDILMSEIDEIKDLALDKVEEVILLHPHERQRRKQQEQLKQQKEKEKEKEKRKHRTHSLMDSSQQILQSPSLLHPSSISYTNDTHSLPITIQDSHQDTSQATTQAPDLMMYFDVKLNNLKASVPLATQDISYVSNALIRPIVAYMNANRTSIPISFGAKMDLRNFDGAWTIYTSGLVDVISDQIGKSLVTLVEDQRERNRRLRRVGLWNLRTLTKGLTYFYDTYIRGARQKWEDRNVFV